MKPLLERLAVFTITLCVVLTACKTSPLPPVAEPTTKSAKSPVPDTIESVKTNAAAAIAAVEKKVEAVEKRSATAAASVDAIKNANTNQPPSPATDFVSKEASLALASLPPPDALAALEAEKRRSAVFSGQADEARRLYALAQTDAEKAKAEAAKLKSEAAAAKTKSEAAQAALVEADKRWAATLKANESANQAKLDAAVARADGAEEKAKNERHKLIFRSLLGLGLLCLAGAIAMAVLTNGAMLAKSLMLAGAGALCIGLAQVISHPWFDRVAGTCLGFAVIGGVFYLWKERQDGLAKVAYERTIEALDTVEAIHDAAGKPTLLGLELGRVLDGSHKSVVKAIKRASAIKNATVGK